MAAHVTHHGADALGIAHATVINVESGTSRNVYLDQIAVMAEVYGVSIAWLVLGRGSAEDKPGRIDLTALAKRFRTSMRHDRTAAGWTNDAMNLATGQNPTSRALTRMESGELRRIDLLRCWRTARVLGADFGAWLGL